MYNIKLYSSTLKNNTFTLRIGEIFITIFRTIYRTGNDKEDPCLVGHLQRFSTLNKNAVLRADPSAHHHRRRGCQTERAGTGNRQNGDGGLEGKTHHHRRPGNILIIVLNRKHPLEIQEIWTHRDIRDDERTDKQANRIIAGGKAIEEGMFLNCCHHSQKNASPQYQSQKSQ